MRAVLMAGGSGTRLRPLTCDLPKPMVPVLNRPIAEHIINLLKRHGITEIIVTLHYLPDIFREYFQDGSDLGVRITYAVEEDFPLGTAGCIKNVEEWLDDTFLVISGDSITDFDLTAAIEFHRQKQSKATLVLTRVPNPIEFGAVIVDSNEKIVRFLEKPSASEIFSDTINTGIYILEPDVLTYLPRNHESDFSKDLFPLLLERGEPLYGYIAEGYWCDIGHLDTYREAHYAALHGKVQLDFPYQLVSPGLWIGKNTLIDDRAKIFPPVVIGDNCRIGARATIESGTVIGDNVMIGMEADLKRPIIWNGVIIGDESHLYACTIARGVRIDRRARVFEGVAIGSLSTVGEESQINSLVRVWPSKHIESGAILNLDLIWGQTAHRNLFGQRGVSGLANIDITPEFAVKLGAAYGSTLPPGTQVTVSRDQRSISRMVTRSFISGLMSVGINVQNLEATPIPVARSVVPTLGVVGGVHVRIDPDRPDRCAIEFFDEKGINLSKAREKKIEGSYFKEDLRRVQIDEIGDVFYPSQTLEIYRNCFEKHLNLEAIRYSNTKIVVDYAYSVSGAILPQLLNKFGCEAMVLNASLTQAVMTDEGRESLLIQLGRVVEAISATFGAQITANGEQLVLVDEAGGLIRGEALTALMVEAVLAAHPRSAVVVPVRASGAIEQIARRHDGQVIRTKCNPTALMETCRTHGNVVLGGSGDMGFIFPDLHPGFDAMFCIAKLIELLAIQERSLADLRVESLPRIYHKCFTVRCPWTVKGSLMRYVVEQHASETLELIDGVKVHDRTSESWILLLPDASEPLVHLIADSPSRDWVDRSLRDYRQLIQEFIARNRGIEEIAEFESQVMA
jgi:mannose-1-phosphate guanylyltransferase/phosphomannomutase